MSKARKTKDVSLEIAPAPLLRIVRVDDIKDGEERYLEVNQAESAEIAGLLDLVALDHLSFDCRFQWRGEGRLVLRGTLQASVTQTCVVSLEPVASSLQVAVEIEFWPKPRIDQLAGSSDEVASHGLLDWPEPIVEGKIDLGPVIYESLATALELYPRREGASVKWPDANLEAASGEKRDNPFAALERLKRR